jgi:hypothetical protein
MGTWDKVVKIAERKYKMPGLEIDGDIKTCGAGGYWVKAWVRVTREDIENERD